MRIKGIIFCSIFSLIALQTALATNDSPRCRNGLLKVALENNIFMKLALKNKKIGPFHNYNLRFASTSKPFYALKAPEADLENPPRTPDEAVNRLKKELVLAVNEIRKNPDKKRRKLELKTSLGFADEESNILLIYDRLRLTQDQREIRKALLSFLRKNDLALENSVRGNTIQLHIEWNNSEKEQDVERNEFSPGYW